MTDATMAPPLPESEPMTPEQIIAYRQQHDLSREQLAALLKVAPGTVRNWEQNVRTMPAPTELAFKTITAARIARAKKEHPRKRKREPGRRPAQAEGGSSDG